MIPILYDYSETEWTSNGLGRLSDCLSCTVTEERNGIYECEFEYPITGIHYADIVEGRIIGVIHDDTKEIEPFDIYKRSAEINGIVTFSAHHISYRLSYITLKPFTASSCAGTMASLPTNSINNNPFTFSTDKTTSGNYNLETPTAIREMLCGSQGSILDVYGTGEYEFKRLNVFLWAHRGQDSGVEVRYGKNMVDLTKDYDISGSYNAVAPFWYSADGTLITLPEEIIISPTIINTGSEPWTTESLAGMTDENGIQIDFDYAVINVVPMDLTAEFADVPTVEELRAKATARLANSSAWLPDENLKIDFVALWQTEEYKDVAPLQRVSLCDTVSVFFPQMGVNAVKAKVIKTVYNVLLECYNKMELGNAQYSFAEVVSDTTANKLSRTMASKGFLTASIDRATKLIQGGLGGHVVLNTNADGEPQEILVMDTDDINTAVNVIRINRNGIGFSTDGYAGTYRTAWTIDGHFVADFIDAGTLNANLITAGSMSGERITARTITADKMNVNNLAAISADLGTITAGSISANLITSGSLSADRISGGVIRSDDGTSYWSLARGRFHVGSLVLENQNLEIEDGTLWSYYIDKTKSVRLGSDGVSFNDPEYNYITEGSCAKLMTADWTSDGDSNRHSILKVTSKKGIAIFTGLTPALIFNSGLNPYGHTEDIVANGTARFKSAVYFGGTAEFNNTTTLNSTTYIYATAYTRALTPTTNGSYKIGTSSRLYSEVWSQSIDFSSGVYINYNSSTDKIYSSKSITQGSDERLKNIYQYDDRYDDFLEDLEPIIYAWKDHPDGSRYVGLGARKTADILDKHGIKDSGFVGIGKDDKGEEVYGIDYTELSVMLLHKVQKQEKRIKELETTLNDVLERLERLEA